ncbi:DUF1990 family protein [Homoserinibacter sp. YIM 151385]|uniref:DUF1990 family protein n=1 Tax=Homoserinibacter sp. YIM 151385 TaxID=2985506 RepID=UPI0022EFF71D|nr:DUF1990 domain-containing protein [Homoserinibacter sp. YIM 151385]WBU38936.1 DUF1990 domain-containing protein [Homoserinibacter sp. YIM 151385]
MSASRPLPYPRAGATRDAEILSDPPRGFRARERRAAIGSGEAHWELARRQVLSWGVKELAGFGVLTDSRVDGRVSPGDPAELRYPVLGMTLREPVQVVWVEDARRRAGFGYGTMPGHPLRGEEAFLLEWGEDDVVRLTVRSFSRPAGLWRLLALPLRLAQRGMTRRYLRRLARSMRDGSAGDRSARDGSARDGSGG